MSPSTSRAGRARSVKHRCGFERRAAVVGRALRYAWAPRPPAAQPQSTDIFKSGKTLTFVFCVDILCDLNIEMTSLCKVDVTLPWGSKGLEGCGAGGVDEQEGNRPAKVLLGVGPAVCVLQMVSARPTGHRRGWQRPRGRAFDGAKGRMRSISRQPGDLVRLPPDSSQDAVRPPPCRVSHPSCDRLRAAQVAITAGVILGSLCGLCRFGYE